jgi:hypothetical protein
LGGKDLQRTSLMSAQVLLPRDTNPVKHGPAKQIINVLVDRTSNPTKTRKFEAQ